MAHYMRLHYFDMKQEARIQGRRHIREQLYRLYLRRTKSDGVETLAGLQNSPPAHISRVAAYLGYGQRMFEMSRRGTTRHIV